MYEYFVGPDIVIRMDQIVEAYNEGLDLHIHTESADHCLTFDSPEDAATAISEIAKYLIHQGVNMNEERVNTPEPADIKTPAQAHAVVDEDWPHPPGQTA